MNQTEKQVTDLTNGDPGKMIRSFYFPMLCTCTLQQLYNIADTIIVGKGIGDDALAAVGTMTSLVFLIIGSCIGLANGYGIPIAQSFGAKNYQKMRKYIGNAVFLSILISIVLTFFSVWQLPVILQIMQVPDKIFSDSRIYGTIIFGGMVITLFYNLAASILRALGDSKTPFIAILASSAINIVLDYILVCIVHTGVAGAAAATIFAQFISAVICIIRLSEVDLLKMNKEDYRPDGQAVGELLRNGIPMAIMSSITAFGCTVVQFFVNGMGVVYTAAYSSCIKIINLFMQPSFAVGNAISAYTSQNYGARKPERIRQGTKIAVKYALGSYVIFAFIMLFAPRQLAGLMLNGEEPIALAATFFRRCGIMMWVVDLLFVYRSACQGMGKALVPMLSGGMEMAMRVLIILIFVHRIGYDATSFAEIGAWSGALMMNITAYYYFLRKTEAAVNIDK